MALWEQAFDAHPEEQVGVRLASIIFASSASPTEEGISFRALLARPLDRPGPVNMLGYGLFAREDGRVVPALFVEQEDRGTSSTRLEISDASDELGLAQFGPLPRTLEVVGVRRPSPLSSKRRPHLNQSLSFDPPTVGTLGMPTRRGSDSGYTTAGHNSPQCPTGVYDEFGSLLGTVTFSIGLFAGEPLSPRQDVAFIQTGPFVADQTLKMVGTAALGDEIEIVTPTGTRRSLVRSVMPAMLWTADRPAWGEVFMTSEPISAPGDSGAIVQKPDGTVVGHVVAGDLASYTLVQDIQYALSALA